MNIMKSVLTLILVLFFGAVAIAQNSESNDKVDTIKMDVVLVTSTPAAIVFEKIAVSNEQSVARLYRYPNSRVKKALSFKTRKDRPKLA